MKDDLCTRRRFVKPPGLNQFDSYTDVLLERDILERLPIQYLVEKMNLAMRAMIGGIHLIAPAEGIRPLDQVISRPFLFEPRAGQILPYRGRWLRRVPFK